jgi:putative N6-adenine-specific DNA methylase
MNAAKERVSRAAGKLEAALERFGLRGKLRGALAVDVGSSAGGFTETLLRHGARHVVAVDVGEGQLHPRLRADPRVELLERTDWRTLPLAVAPGPFDFFSVDVSFAAARNMLRGLAFRLRPGAEGVVLVKPQFELPKHRVRKAGLVPREGRADGAAARREAVSLVARKAEALGFALLASHDSPVPGASGTVEVLAHLRFAGRPASLPAPGEKRAAPAAQEARRAGRARRQAGRGAEPEAGPEAGRAAEPDAAFAWFAAAAPGTEELVLREVATLPGVGEATRVPGGVEFVGPLEAGLRANLGLRIASRVWARVGAVEAREFALLRRRVATLPWERFVPPGAALRVKASASRSRLYHTDAIAETVALGVSDRLRRHGARSARAGETGAAEGAPATLVLARGESDRFTLRVDASGALLHQRGWRAEGGPAPLRETLAAALLALADWDPATPLVDPLCGGGTIAIEAALVALRRAPGVGRRFALEAWPCADAARCRATRDEMEAEATAAAAAGGPAVFGYDHAEDALDRARRNAERAGVAEHVRFERRELGEVRAPRGHGRGLVLANPPYGRRLGDDAEARALYARLGWVLKERFARWRAAIVVPAPALAAALRMKPVASHRLAHGGLRVALLRYQL